MEQQDIGDILDQPEAEVSAPAETGISRDDKGRFAPKAETSEAAGGTDYATTEPTGEKPIVAPPPVAAPPPDDREKAGLLAALVDERLERRQAKQRLEELERELREARAPKPKQFDPDEIYTNPEEAIRRLVQAETETIRREQQSDRMAVFEERLHRIAGGEKAAQIEAEVGKALEAGDPEIQLLAHAVQTRGLSAVKDLVDWYDLRTFDPAAKEAEMEAKILAKYGITPGAEPKPTIPSAVMPSNLAAARNVGNRSAGPAWSGPPRLDDIFKK